MALIIIAAILFALGFIFHGFGFHPNAWLAWPSLAMLGLFFTALHLAGVGALVAGWRRH
jgi:hypothetical protein